MSSQQIVGAGPGLRPLQPDEAEGDTIEVVPAPHPYLDRDPQTNNVQVSTSATGSPDDGRLALAYQKAVARYERDLTEGLRSRMGPPTERYPRVDVALPGGTATVVFDPGLDRALLEIYILHGWPGIAAIQKAVETAAERRWYRALYPWEVVGSFFVFTRNRLLLLIGAEMITIERYAAARVRAQLSETITFIDRVLADLRLETTDIGPHGVVEPIPMPPYAHSDVVLDPPLRSWYRIGNTELARRLFPLVDAAVDLLDTQRVIEAHVAELREEIGDGPANPLSNESEQCAYEQTRLRQIRAELERMMSDIAEICPLAVLALPLLTNDERAHDPAQRRHAMEHRIGEAVTPLRGKTAQILGGADTGTSWIHTELPSWDFRQPLEQVFEPTIPKFVADLLDEPHVDPEAGLEAAIASLALSRAGSRPEYLPILSERTLDGLIEPTGPIPKDSLTYVTWAHYRSALIVALGEEKENQKLTQEVLGALAKVAALLSLALLFTPAGAVLKGVQVALGVGLLVMQTYSVVNTLAILDRGIDQAIVDIDRTDVRTLSALAELTSLGREYVTHIRGALLIELGLIVAAGAFTQLKLLLHLRGYYDDLQTLLGD